MSMQEVMDPQTFSSGDDWTWDGRAWIMRPIHFPQRPRPPFPPFPPCPPFPSRPINGPIAGVTTGAAARPGEVGEFLVGSSNINVAILAAEQTLLAQPLVLPPGDWDIEAQLTLPLLTSEAVFFAMIPMPAGISPSVAAYGAVVNATSQFQGILTSNRAQALVTVPTLLPFQINIFNATTTSAAYLTVSARRMR